MSPSDQRLLGLILRRDFGSFARKVFTTLNPGTSYVPGWHIDVIAEWLTIFDDDDGLRLIVNLPPRHLKSLLGSIALPAWLLGRNPSRQIICASYSAEFANKLSRDCRTVMESAWYRTIFPGTILVRSAAHELTTLAHGGRLATSIEGVLTGRGADLIIVDDPLKPEEALSDPLRRQVNEWFDSTLFSRLNDKQSGQMLVIMQRLHEDDLTGHLWEREGWHKLVLPAIAEKDERFLLPSRGEKWVGRKVGEALHPERENHELLSSIRRNMGEYNFSGQYQQAPAPREGGMVKRGWFRTYAEGEMPARFDFVLQSWDTANKPSELSDYSVCTTWGRVGRHVYLLHVFRGKLGYPELKRAVQTQAEYHNPRIILIEDKASGTQLIQELRRDGLWRIKPYQPEPGMNKQMRLHAQTALIENGFVHLPKQAEWLAEYLHELTTFPASKYDDQVDSTAQALHWMQVGKTTTGLIDFYEERAREISQSFS